jgi:16S rRNA processing protein RimM
MILMGAIAGVHGVKGEVKVKSFTGDPLAIAAYGPLYDDAGKSFELKLSSKSAKESVVIAKIAGITDRNAAEALKGRRLYAPREAMPELAEPDEFYAADLVGLAVEDAEGRKFGTVADLQDHGAGPVLAIEGGPEGAFDLPFAQRFVPVVDLAARRIVVDLPEDFFAVPARDDEEEQYAPSPQPSPQRGEGAQRSFTSRSERGEKVAGNGVPSPPPTKSAYADREGEGQDEGAAQDGTRSETKRR